MVRKGAMVLLGTFMLVVGSGAMAHAQTGDVSASPSTDAALSAAQSAEMQKAKQVCEQGGGWFDTAAGACDDDGQ